MGTFQWREVTIVGYPRERRDTVALPDSGLLRTPFGVVHGKRRIGFALVWQRGRLRWRWYRRPSVQGHRWAHRWTGRVPGICELLHRHVARWRVPGVTEAGRVQCSPRRTHVESTELTSHRIIIRADGQASNSLKNSRRSA